MSAVDGTQQVVIFRRGLRKEDVAEMATKVLQGIGDMDHLVSRGRRIGWWRLPVDRSLIGTVPVDGLWSRAHCHQAEPATHDIEQTGQFIEAALVQQRDKPAGPRVAPGYGAELVRSTREATATSAISGATKMRAALARAISDSLPASPFEPASRVWRVVDLCIINSPVLRRGQAPDHDDTQRTKGVISWDLNVSARRSCRRLSTFSEEIYDR